MFLFDIYLYIFLGFGGVDRFAALAGRSSVDFVRTILTASLKSVYVVCSRTFLYDHSTEYTEHAASFVLHKYGQETRQCPHKAVLEVAQPSLSWATQHVEHKSADEK
jgi:hypothetical protein